MSYLIAIIALGVVCVLWARLQVANDATPTPGCGPCTGCERSSEACHDGGEP